MEEQLNKQKQRIEKLLKKEVDGEFRSRGWT